MINGNFIQELKELYFYSLRHKNHSLIIGNYSLHVLFPMFTGVLFYMLVRQNSLFYINDTNINIPNFLNYNLPDLLWQYSLTSSILIIWKNDSNKAKYAWLVGCSLLGVFSEILQYYYFIPGTFDLIDIVFFIIGGVLPYFFKI